MPDFVKADEISLRVNVRNVKLLLSDYVTDINFVFRIDARILGIKIKIEMPGFDRTGPFGQGSKTGRKLGKCSTENETLADEFPGRGLGRGLGRRFRLGGGWNFPGQGRGFGRGRGDSK